MSRLPRDTIALRQVIVVGALAFLIGMIGVLAFFTWVMWRFVEPATPLHQLLHLAVQGLIFAVLGGMALAAGAMGLLSWWHFRTGVHRCIRCGRALGGISVPCECEPHQAASVDARLTEKGRQALFPGGWKPVYCALSVYVALVPFAYLVSINAPGRKEWPLWSYTAVMHALICALVAMTCKIGVMIVEQWGRTSRLIAYTDHIENFIAVLAVWPFCVSVMMVFWKMKHG